MNLFEFFEFFEFFLLYYILIFFPYLSINLFIYENNSYIYTLHLC